MPEGIPYASSNVVAGAGLELNYVGNHVYGYSGGLAASTSSQTALSFTTGNEVIVGEMQYNVPVRFLSDGQGKSGVCEIKMNGLLIANLSGDNASRDSPTSETMKIIIPPYTLVVMNVISGTDSADHLCSVSLVGRIHK
jgi:hypothetical protein